MNIILTGAGKVGYAVAERLAREGHDLTVIDQRPERITQISNALDVISVEGNGASFSLLADLNIRNADVLIAATGKDEVNLVCASVARQLSAGRDGEPLHVIARIKAPEYAGHPDMLLDGFGISMVVNPDKEAAREIYRVLRFPSATRVETFSGGKVEMVEFRIPEGSAMDGLPLHQLYKTYKTKVLICVVERNGEICIPNGQFVLHSGDRLSITASRAELHAFFKAVGAYRKAARSVLILGGSHIAVYLTQQLLEVGVKVTIIEKDREICERLCQLLPRASVICGDGTKREVLLEEGLKNNDAFVAVTGFDESNIITAMYAVTQGVGKVAAKVNEEHMIGMLDGSGLDCFITPKQVVAQQIVRYVRALQNSVGSSVERLYQLMDGQVEALEFVVRASSRCVGVPLKDLHFRSGTLVAALIRNGSCIIPDGETTLRENDHAIVVTSSRGLRELDDTLKEGA